MREVDLNFSQRKILRYMRENGGMTGQDAIRSCHIVDYRKRISELRAKGYRFSYVWERKEAPDGSIHRFKRYWLEEEPHEQSV